MNKEENAFYQPLQVHPREKLLNEHFHKATLLPKSFFSLSFLRTNELQHISRVAATGRKSLQI